MAIDMAQLLADQATTVKRKRLQDSSVYGEGWTDPTEVDPQGNPVHHTAPGAGGFSIASGPAYVAPSGGDTTSGTTSTGTNIFPGGLQFGNPLMGQVSRNLGVNMQQLIQEGIQGAKEASDIGKATFLQRHGSQMRTEALAQEHQGQANLEQQHQFGHHTAFDKALQEPGMQEAIQAYQTAAGLPPTWRPTSPESLALMQEMAKGVSDERNRMMHVATSGMMGTPEAAASEAVKRLGLGQTEAMVEKKETQKPTTQTTSASTNTPGSINTFIRHALPGAGSAGLMTMAARAPNPWMKALGMAGALAAYPMLKSAGGNSPEADQANPNAAGAGDVVGLLSTILTGGRQAGKQIGGMSGKGIMEKFKNFRKGPTTAPVAPRQAGFNVGPTGAGSTTSPNVIPPLNRQLPAPGQSGVQGGVPPVLPPQPIPPQAAPPVLPTIPGARLRSTVVPSGGRATPKVGTASQVPLIMKPEYSVIPEEQLNALVAQFGDQPAVLQTYLDRLVAARGRVGTPTLPGVAPFPPLQFSRSQP